MKVPGFYFIEKKLRNLRNKFFEKPTLPYLEMHIVEYCNLNCRRCGHYSNIGYKEYISVKDFKKTVKRLKKIFKTVTTFRIMGGEPLLHPDLLKILELSRHYLRKTNIRIATNGLLLDKQKDNFWEKCRQLNIGIDMTIYPPLRNKEEPMHALCNSKGVDLFTGYKVENFFAIRNRKGTSDPKKSIEICRKGSFCPIIKNGRLYVCAVAVYISNYNKKFNQTIPEGKGIDIYKHSGKELLQFLFEPEETCRYCAYDYNTFKWDNSGDIHEDDWDGKEI